MRFPSIRHALCGALITGLAGCGGGGSAGVSGTAATQYGSVPMVVSDASSEDWALIGVKVLSVALIPQGGGADVTVYTAPATAPYVNLEQLDQLGEILGNAQVPVGTYTGAVVSVGGNPGDVLLTTSADPEPGFAGAASTSIPAGSIQIQHAQGSAGSKMVPVTVTFDAPLVVTANASNALDLEFDLSHPAFIIGHQPPGSGLLWAVNFNGPIRRHPIAHLAHLVLRQHYATLASVAADGSAITVDKAFPTYPIVNPETAVTTTDALTIDVDSANGTLFYDVDAKAGPSKITSFAGVAALSSGKFLRIQARYQDNGTLVATRVWASSSFNSVWLSPEGHVLHVDAAGGTITVTNESAVPVTLQVDGNTAFYFHGGTTPIGTGTSFLGNVVRGFKVHASVVDPLATPLVAQSIDIETAQFSGAISGANSAGFSYTHAFVRATDDYTQNLAYISASTANGSDGSGNAISGFKYWPFAYPTQLTSGSNAITDFVSATTAQLPAYGFTAGNWGDQSTSSGWFAPWVGLLPVPVPLATVTAGVSGSGNDQFQIATVAALGTIGAGTTFTVDVSTTSGSAPLVYQIDRTNGIVTVSPVDITASSGLQTFTSALTVNTPVKVFAVPNADGTLKSYTIFYYTGTAPST